MKEIDSETLKSWTFLQRNEKKFVREMKEPVKWSYELLTTLENAIKKGFLVNENGFISQTEKYKHMKSSNLCTKIDLKDFMEDSLKGYSPVEPSLMLQYFSREIELLLEEINEKKQKST